jgi:tripeptide aminopeptidase
LNRRLPTQLLTSLTGTIVGAALCCTVALAESLPPLVKIDASLRAAFSPIIDEPRVQAALASIVLAEPESIKEQIRLTEIPAPPFMEQKRAEYFLGLLQQRGMSHAYIDDEGNVVVRRKGGGKGPLLVIAAHLDTVFPSDVDTQVEFRDQRYYAPGIGDDTRGLATMLSVMDALDSSGLQTIGDIMFVANVGEEGRGDLRGIKAIFRDHPEIDGFISIDGVNLSHITTGGTGSRRFEFQFSGPGGHSFSAFGTPSAIHAMGRTISKIADFETPSLPKTTFTVGTVDGGTSVNTIAGDAVFALDMRSNDPDELAKLEARAKAAALAAVVEENARWNNGDISVAFELIGDRPAGRTNTDSALVTTAALAYAGLDLPLMSLHTSSTDSNLPMSLGIPAMTIGGGGNGGGAHTLQEWFAPTNSHQGPQLAFLIVLGLAGIEGVSPALLPVLSK